MRSFCIALACLVLASCATTPDAPIESVVIKEVKPRYIPAQNFKRIGEYLTGAEDTGRRILLRSQPDQRSGYYFILVLDTNIRQLPQGTQIIGEFYTPDSLEAKTYTYTLPSKRPKTKEVFVGLTGSDWPNSEAVPAAWKFTIKTPTGTILDTHKSYLWEL